MTNMSKHNMQLLNLSEGISAFGTSVFTFSVSFYILRVTGSATSYALTLCMNVLALIITTPIASQIVDFFPKKKLFIICDIISGFLLVSLCIPMLLYPHTTFLPFFYLITFFLNSISNLYNVTLESSKLTFVTKEDLLPLNAILKVLDATSGTIAPVLGGLVFSMLPFPFFLLFDGLSFLFSAFCKYFLHEISSSFANIKTYVSSSHPIDKEETISSSVFEHKKRCISLSFFKHKKKCISTSFFEHKKRCISLSFFKHKKKCISTSFFEHKKRCISTSFSFHEFMQHNKEGILYLLQNPSLKSLFFILLYFNLFLSFSITVPVPFYITNTLHLSSKILGITEAFFSCGIILGALLVTHVLRAYSAKKLILISCICSGCSMFGFYCFQFLPDKTGYSMEHLSPIVLTCLFMLLLGIFVSMIDLPLFMELQLQIPQAMQGRVFSQGLCLIKLFTPLALILSGMCLNRGFLYSVFFIGAFGMLLFTFFTAKRL